VKLLHLKIHLLCWLLLGLVGLTACGAAPELEKEPDYYCVVCGKGPLAGKIWRHKWGLVCSDCYQSENRCSLCGLPIGKDYLKTGDGRFICKFDRTNVVLEASDALDIFNEARRDLIAEFGSGLALTYPEVSVKLFDVDYWSEKGRSDGLHKFGFSSTRKTASGECTHQVVMLSGRRREELAATAAHEYTHLWINENCPAGHKMDGDTVEAICELVAYKLMCERNQTEQMEQILKNPYTHGTIVQLLEVEKDNSLPYILNWIKTSTAPNFSTPTTTTIRTAAHRGPVKISPPRPIVWPETLKLGGLIEDGNRRRAVINGISFTSGDTRNITLANRKVRVTCRAIQSTSVVLEVDGQTNSLTLQLGEAKLAP